MVLSREPVARHRPAQETPSMALPAPGHLPPPCRQGVVLQEFATPL
jgi:hypothetical protein